MKTIREWFETFPEPYRSQALGITMKDRGQEYLNDTTETAYEALDGAFTWGAQQQGQEYWQTFFNTLK